MALAIAFAHTSKGHGILSPNERILAAVCELRSALASGAWLERLKTNCHKELATARFALNEIGAMSVAARISDTVVAMRRVHLVRRRQTLLSKLERDLNAAGPALDRSIAKFAQSLLDAGGGAPAYVRTAQLAAAGTACNQPSNGIREDVSRTGTGRRFRSGSNGT